MSTLRIWLRLIPHMILQHPTDHPRVDALIRELVEKQLAPSPVVERVSAYTGTHT